VVVCELCRWNSNVGFIAKFYHCDLVSADQLLSKKVVGFEQTFLLLWTDARQLEGRPFFVCRRRHLFLFFLRFLQEKMWPPTDRVGIAGGWVRRFDPQLSFQPHIAYYSSTIMTLAVHCWPSKLFLGIPTLPTDDLLCGRPSSCRASTFQAPTVN